MKFGINGKHSKEYNLSESDKHIIIFPFQLIINDNQAINGHIYVKSIKEAKDIADSIVKKIKTQKWQMVKI